jgi:hypothetical protein
MAAIQQILMAVGTSVFLPSSLIASAIGESYADQAASAGVSLNLSTNGILQLVYSANGTLQDPSFPVTEQFRWLVGGSSTLFSVRMRKISGSAFSFGSAAIDTWIPITTSLNWNIISSSNSFQPFNSKAVTAVLEIAFSNNLTNILAQSNISFSTSASTQGGSIQ